MTRSANSIKQDNIFICEQLMNESPNDVALFYGSHSAFSPISGPTSRLRTLRFLSAGKAGVTEIGRKRYRDVTHSPFSLRTLTLLCEELSYFDWEQKRSLLRTASKAGWRKLIPARN